MNRRSKVVPLVAATLLLLAVVGMASPASAQRYRHHSRGGVDWGISLNFGTPYYYDPYVYDGYYDGYGLGYYIYPTYRYHRSRDWDDDYRWRGHDRGPHYGWRNHRR